MLSKQWHSNGVDLAKIFSNNKQSEISVRDRTYDRNPHCVHNKRLTIEIGQI
jgi:hypothetical protein